MPSRSKSNAGRVAVPAEPRLPEALAPLAVKVAGTTRSPSLLPWLLARVEGKKGLFGKKLADTTPVMLASIEALAQHYAEKPEAAEVLALAAKSRDDEVRTAVTRRASVAMRAIPDPT